MITLRLPIPPSLNRMYATSGNRRVMSIEAKAWKFEAHQSLVKSGCYEKYADTITQNLRAQDSCRVIKGKTAKISLQKLKRTIKHSYIVSYWVFFPNNSYVRDVMNYEKALSDFLCSKAFMLDDQFIRDFHAYKRVAPCGEGGVVVKIRKVENKPKKRLTS
jgi:Holliday junction resolvase RusA-like endonuclease